MTIEYTDAPDGHLGEPGLVWNAERIIAEQAAEIERLRAVISRFKFAFRVNFLRLSATPISHEEIDAVIARIEASKP